MFSLLQIEISDRFRQIEEHFNASPRSPAEVAQTGRGVVFVEAYAAYEYTVRTATRQAVDEIVAHGHRINRLKPPLLALFLDAELKALRDVSEKRIWEKRITLLQKVFSSSPVTAVLALPHDGNYYRHTQLQMTYDVLGITKTITIRKRHKYKIDEVVDNRNKIAHGEETPAEIGRRYSTAEVKAIVRTMKGICYRIVDLMSEHCSKPDRYCRK